MGSCHQGDFQDPVRLPKVTAQHLRYAENGCSLIKEGITRMRFIHLNKVDHQSDVAAELLDKRRKGCKETERKREASRVVEKASQI